MKLNEQQLENLLRKLPRMTRSVQANALFLEKLDERAHGKKHASDFFRSFFAWPRFAWNAAVFMIFLMAATTFAAYQPSVTRGSKLYPWKQAAERIELAFAKTPTQEVNTHLRFGDRRLQEAEHIIQKNPSLAWLVPAARAHGDIDDIHLDTAAAVFLAETLEDMRNEMETAGTIVEAKITEPAAAEQALDKIAAAAQKHVAQLQELEEKTDMNAKKIFRRIRDEEEQQYFLIIAAGEEVKTLRTKQEKKVELKFSKFRKKAAEMKRAEDEKKEEKKREKEEAKEEKREEKTERIEEKREGKKTLQEKLEQKLEQATEALEENKVGRAEGLINAVEKKLENETRKNEMEKEEKPDKKPEKIKPLTPSRD